MSGEKQTLLSCVSLVVRDGDNLLLSRRKNTGYQDGSYSLVSGHVDDNEFPREAAIREGKEEACVDFLASKLKLVHTSHQICEVGPDRVNLFFEGTEWSGDIENGEPDKCSELSWFPKDELPDSCIPYIQFVLEKIGDGEIYSEYRGNS